MPHVMIKMFAGQTDAEKKALASMLGETVRKALGCGTDVISVAIEDVEPADWMKQVYEADIASREHLLFKRPGYGPLGA